MTGQPDNDRDQPPAGLVADIMASLSRLFRGELALAKAEARQSVQRAAQGLFILAAALLFGIAALNMLANAAVIGLMAAGLSSLWATFLIGAVLLCLALVYALFGVKLLSPESLKPKRVLRSLRRDAETFQNVVRTDANA